jgi:hypothetical protein
VAFPRAFAEAGSDVVLAARRVDKLEHTAEMVCDTARELLVIATNRAWPLATPDLGQVSMSGCVRGWLEYANTRFFAYGSSSSWECLPHFCPFTRSGPTVGGQNYGSPRRRAPAERVVSLPGYRTSPMPTTRQLNPLVRAEYAVEYTRIHADCGVCWPMKVVVAQ